MKLTEIRRFEMLVRVRDFGVEHAAAFAPDSLGGKTFADLDTLVSELAKDATSQFSGTSSGFEGTSTKTAAREALHHTLEAISSTAQAVSLDTTGLDDKFQLGRYSDQRLLNAARASAQDAAPFKAAFIAHAMPPTFLEDLQAEIDAFEHAIKDRTHAKETRIAAAAGITTSIRAGLSAVQRLDAIVRNTFKNDPEALARYEVARRVAKAGRVRHPEPVTPPAPPPGPAAPASVHVA